MPLGRGALPIVVAGSDLYLHLMASSLIIACNTEPIFQASGMAGGISASHPPSGGGLPSTGDDTADAAQAALHEAMASHMDAVSYFNHRLSSTLSGYGNGFVYADRDGRFY